MSEHLPILFHALALEDLRRLDARDVRRVLDALGDRLTTSPEMYGKPLGGRLAGLRRVRVGDLRVVYRVFADRVEVFIVRHRKDVYQELARRLGSA